jgi:3-methyladenine DNA glycosylase/8-oxoguanine DNA glycosylase
MKREFSDARVREIYMKLKLEYSKMNNEEFFLYGEKELNYLKNNDSKLGLAIDKLGMLRRAVHTDHFEALAMSIVSQQISRKAADSIWNRLEDKFSAVSAKIFADADLNDIHKCGISLRKAGYIKGLAHAVMNRDINFEELTSMSDNEIIAKLSSFPGIGIWTAEMFLIFSMCRMDVVSWGDLAIRRGMMNLYELKELTKEQFDKYRRKYSPYGSVASLYLWASS